MYNISVDTRACRAWMRSTALSFAADHPRFDLLSIHLHLSAPASFCMSIHIAAAAMLQAPFT
jgi:hypothetical protein